MARGFNSNGFGAPLTALCDVCGHRRCDKRYSHVKCAKIRQQRTNSQLTKKASA